MEFTFHKNNENLDDRSKMANMMLKLIYLKHNGNLDKCMPEVREAKDHLEEHVRNIYEVIDKQVPLIRYYDLMLLGDDMSYNARILEFDSEDNYKLAIKEAKEACFLYYRKKELEETGKPKYQDVFNFFAENYNLNLTQTDIEDIIGAVQKEISEVESERPFDFKKAKEEIFLFYNSKEYKELYVSAISAYEYGRTQILTEERKNDTIAKMKAFIDFVAQFYFFGES